MGVVEEVNGVRTIESSEAATLPPTVFSGVSSTIK